MDFESYNRCIRDLINSIIDDGYKHSQVCAITVGNQRSSQLKDFLNGKNLGFKPHDKIMNSLDYTMHLVPIPNGNKEKNEIVEDLTKDFIDDFKFSMIEYLENEDKIKKAENRARPKIFSEKIDELIEIIEKS